MITNSEVFSNIVYGHELRIDGTSLVFPNLFRFPTGVKIVDPTSVGVQSTNFPLETGVQIFSGDLVVPNASRYTDASWFSNGWEPGANLLPKQLAILVSKNKPLSEVNQRKNTAIIKASIGGTNYTVVLLYSGNFGEYAKPVSFTCFPSIPKVLSINEILSDISSEPLEVLSVKRSSGGGFTTSLFNGKVSSVTYTSNQAVGSSGWLVIEAQNLNTGVINDYLVTMYVEAAPPLVANGDVFNMVQWSNIVVTTTQLLSNDSTSYPPITFDGIVAGSAVNGTTSISGSNITFTGTGLTGQPAGFNYRVKDALNNTAIGSVTVNILELPPIEAYLYSGDELTTFLSTYTPPTAETVFNSFDRFSNGNAFYPGGTTPAQESTGWSFSGGNFRSTINSVSLIGLVSPQLYTNFTFQADMSSTASDNDLMAMVAAFRRIDGVNYSLLAVREPGGWTSHTGGTDWALTLQVGTAVTVIRNNNTIPIAAAPNWAGIGSTRVRIQRIGSVIRISGSPWGSTTINPASLIEVDLNDFPNLAWAVDGASYGYAALSQANALWSNVTFEGGLANEVLDPVNNRVYTFNGSSWVIQPSTVTIQSVLGYPRTVTNPETGIVYRVEENSVTIIGP
jgi:hypothetical protein